MTTDLVIHTTDLVIHAILDVSIISFNKFSLTSAYFNVFFCGYMQLSKKCKEVFFFFFFDRC